MTLRAMFPEHDAARVEILHLIMVGDQDIDKAGDLPQARHSPPLTHSIRPATPAHSLQCPRARV
jgi:hypothetical protein